MQKLHEPCIELIPRVIRFANKEALKELHRVLKPAGVLGLIWNIEDCRQYLQFHF